MPGQNNTALAFNGSSSVASLGDQLVDTTESFTVSTWVKLDTLQGWRTIMNQDGDNVSGFWLQYSEQLGKNFIFLMYGDDSLSGAAFRAKSNMVPVVGEWYHLAGVRDKAAGTITLYVNGQLEATANNPSPGWLATGAFNVGRGKWGSPNDWFDGDVDEVNVFDYALTPTEIQSIYQSNASTN